MEKEKINIPFDKILSNIPSLQSVVDYCSLHETTGRESHRERAIDDFKRYNTIINFYNMLLPELASEFHPLIVEKLGLVRELNEEESELAAIINGVIQKLGESADTEGITGWRDHCLGCTYANSKSCGNQREKLVDFQKRVGGNVKEVISGSIKIAKALAESPFYSF